MNLRSFDLAQSTMNVVRFAFGLLLLRFCVAFASLSLCFCFAFAFAFVLLLCCLCFPNGGGPRSYKVLKGFIRPLRGGLIGTPGQETNKKLPYPK